MCIMYNILYTLYSIQVSIISKYNIKFKTNWIVTLNTILQNYVSIQLNNKLCFMYYTLYKMDNFIGTRKVVPIPKII